ncbi:ferric reductase like transmembrane component-domain-containing protein [Lophiotrema nucula]|uniref:ferric-chelate reductase (NADPH) n=1 Tax=Lophiotrema nucula TaxID=690887 RepID=A0A6A5Z5Z9_9PLEO|nr:ferric reductase like transmembrane component-domain-containing protein [Lophiotrema nucula]
MAFGYAFVDLDNDQKHARRVLLEYYPLVGFLSGLVVLALFRIGHLLLWLSSQRSDYGRPRSPSFTKSRNGAWKLLQKTRQNLDQARWWLKKPVVKEWGTRGEWIGGAVWMVWLLSLSFVQTTPDYLHLTKRFGIIGASQLPMHYLLAMRSPWSPVQYLTQLSHEELKGAHQVLGRIIFFLFVLHAAFYLNFFVISGFLAKRIKDKDVILGLVSIALFSVLSTTALGFLRRRNYRIFYISHVAIAELIIPALFLHVTHIRPYIYGVLVVNIAHLLLREKALAKYHGSIKLLPGTNLVQVRIPLSAGDKALTWKPGQHVYLSLPSGRAHAKSVYDQFALRNLTNPFSIASIPAKDEELLLVARTLDGNTKKLAALARSLAASEESSSDVSIAIEGPYGASTRLPDFSSFDKILLVAGGVGGTFVMPIYRALLSHHDDEYAGSPQVRLIWSVRKLAETQWAFPAWNGARDDELETETPSHNSIVEVFVTQPSGPALHVIGSSDDIEMAEDEQLLSIEEQMEKPPKGMSIKAGRPDVRAIVDETLSKDGRVAVLCCGPHGLTEELGRCVETWVKRGSDVYWHDETFGW